MPGLRLTFTLPYGLEPLTRTLVRFGDATQDFTAVWDQIIADARRITGQRFDEQGPGWAPLSERYAAEKARTHPGAPILVRSGELRYRLVTNPDVLEVTPLSFAYGIRASFYGRFHQTGTRNMPARPPFGFTEAHKREWVRIAQRHIIESGRS